MQPLHCRTKKQLAKLQKRHDFITLHSILWPILRITLLSQFSTCASNGAKPTYAAFIFSRLVTELILSPICPPALILISTTSHYQPYPLIFTCENLLAN